MRRIGHKALRRARAVATFIACLAVDAALTAAIVAMTMAACRIWGLD